MDIGEKRNSPETVIEPVEEPRAVPAPEPEAGGPPEPALGVTPSLEDSTAKWS